MPDDAQIFCSYSRQDGEFMLRLATDLRAAGQPLWLDQLDISAGSRWDQSVEGALKATDRMLVILSPASTASNNVMDEVSFALEQGKQVIPVLHQPCEIPFRLRRVQHIDFTQDYDSGLQRLVRHLNGPQAASSTHSGPIADGQSTKPDTDGSPDAKKRRPVMAWLFVAVVAIAAIGFLARDYLPGSDQPSNAGPETTTAPTPVEQPAKTTQTPSEKTSQPTSGDQVTATGATCDPHAKPFRVQLFNVGSECHVIPKLHDLQPGSTSRQWNINLVKTKENNPVVWGFQTANNWSAKIDSHLEVRHPGQYTFDVTLAHADAAWLNIAGKNLIRTGCVDTATVETLSETIELEAGVHRLELFYGDDGWPDALQLHYAGPDTNNARKLVAPPAAVYCED